MSSAEWHPDCNKYGSLAIDRVFGRLGLGPLFGHTDELTSKRRSPWLCPAPSWGAGLYFARSLPTPPERCNPSADRHLGKDRLFNPSFLHPLSCQSIVAVL